MYNSGINQKEPMDFKKHRKTIIRILVAVVAVFVAAVLVGGSVFTLNSGEEAAITRFGKYEKTITDPGLQFKVPFVEERHIVNTQLIQRLIFGADEQDRDIPSESTMLTQEENLVKADLVIQYRVSDSYNYLFKVEDPVSTLRIISQSSYRRVVAAHTLDDILTTQKDVMMREIQADLQEICNKYELGVTIIAVQLQDTSAPDEVKQAFLDVTNAIEDKNTKINEANKYANEQLPKARGDAEALLNEAQAYKAKRVNEALGGVARYKALQSEYAKQPEIMKTRMYLEMVQSVFPNFEKIYFVDPNGQTLEFLPLAPLSGAQ